MPNPVGRPQKYTEEELKQKVKEFFEKKDKDRVSYLIYVLGGREGKLTEKVAPPTMSGLAVHLDICRETLYDWLKDTQFSHTIKKAKAKIEHMIFEAMFKEETNVTTGIFVQKALHGMYEKQIVKTDNVNYNVEYTKDQLSKLSDEELDVLSKIGDKLK